MAELAYQVTDFAYQGAGEFVYQGSVDEAVEEAARGGLGSKKWKGRKKYEEAPEEFWLEREKHLRRLAGEEQELEQAVALVALVAGENQSEIKDRTEIADIYFAIQIERRKMEEAFTRAALKAHGRRLARLHLQIGKLIVELEEEAVALLLLS